MEESVRTLGKDHIAVVAGYTLLYSTTLFADSIVDKLGLAQLTRLHIERRTIQIVTQLLVMIQRLVHAIVQRFELVAGRTEIKPFAVGTPRGEQFQLYAIVFFSTS